MSNFPGDLFAYDNPLISIYNPWTYSLSPAVPGGTLVPNVSKTPSFGITLPARINAFHMIEKALKKPIMGEYLYEGDWSYDTVAQQDFKFFISRYKPYHSIENITRLKVSSNAGEINKFFQEHGSRARMSNIASGYGVGVVSRMSYPWMRPAQEALIGNYRGIELSNGFEILESKDNFHLPLIRIQTRDPNIKAVIKMADPRYSMESPYQLVFNFLNQRRWRHFYRLVTKDYNALRFPQIRKEINEDVSHLNGMCLQKYNKQTGMFQSFSISEIKQQTMVNIGVNGVNIGTNFQTKTSQGKEGFTRPIFNVNKPFIFWLEHDWIPSYPLFIGFFNRDSWVKSS